MLEDASCQLSQLDLRDNAGMLNNAGVRYNINALPPILSALQHPTVIDGPLAFLNLAGADLDSSLSCSTAAHTFMWTRAGRNVVLAEGTPY